MTELNWFNLDRQQKQEHYPLLVRQTFAHTPFPSAEEVAVLLPTALGPELVQIEITTYCNLKCRECGRTKGINEGTWFNGHMALETYREILAKLPRVEKIFLQGVGEPSMHPHFVELVRLAAESGKCSAICFNSNGLVHKDEFWIGLGERYPILHPALSIDSLDPKIAELCRSGTNAEMLFARLQLFRDVFPHLTVALVASKLNLHDIPATLEKIAALGPGIIGIQNVITDDKEVALDQPALGRLMEILTASHEASPHLVIRWGTKSTGLKRCIAPFLAQFVTLEGFLTPCCVLADPTPFNRTSLLGEKTWDQVRSSEGVQNWMRAYVTTDPEPCHGCTFNPAMSEQTRERRHGDHFATESA